jgi:hypothetical protein
LQICPEDHGGSKSIDHPPDIKSVPDLDLVVAFYGGNYSSPIMCRIQEELVPGFILPAVDADE